MTMPRRRRALSRRQKIGLAVGATLAGTVLLTGVGLLIQAGRETDLGDPNAGVTSDFRGGGDVQAPEIRFEDVAAALGVRMRHGPGPRSRTLPEDTGSGVAWGDVDGDGDFDLYFVNFAQRPPAGVEFVGADRSGSENRLFRNDGGHFTDVTEAAGVGDPLGFGMGASFADYDADGDVDLYVLNHGPNRLFRNRGDGTFEDVAQAAGVDDLLWSTCAAWGDFDRDGHLDLYVSNYVRYDVDALGSAAGTPSQQAGRYAVPFTLNPNGFDPQPNRLYRNRGDGTYEDVAASHGVQNPQGRSFAAAFCDLDGDGWLDLYVNNDVSANRMYRNRGDRVAPKTPRFKEIGVATGTADPRGSMGLSVADIGAMSGTADGLPDLFITHWVAQENALYESLRTPGGVEYRDRNRRFRLGEISLDRVGWGSAFVDLDLDGRVDLVVANGSTLEDKDDPGRLVAEPLFLLWNTGSSFFDVAPAAGEATARAHGARGLAAADFDGDGDVDLAVAVNRGAPLLLRNETQTANRSLVLRLDGPPAACFGARVQVEASGRAQTRWWGADVSVFGNHAAEMVFGLGTAARADRVHVRWADGRESTEASVPAGRVTIRHPGR